MLGGAQGRGGGGVLMTTKQRGLSLIELLIGLAIVGILVMTALPSYTAWLQNTKIRNAAESVSNGLQLARAEAVRQNTNVEFVLGTASDWTVGVVGAATPIQSRSSAQGSIGVTVEPTPGAANTVTFNSLGRVAPNAGGSTSLTAIDFNVPTSILPADQSRELQVTVSAGGGIRMCDPTVTEMTDTRRC